MSALTEGPLKGPYSYNDYGTMIACADNPMCLEIRGWGYLTGRGALALNEDVAIKHQDAFAEAVVTALNGYDEQADTVERQGQMIVRQAEQIQRMEARLALYDKYLGDTMQKTENAELRALVKAAYSEGRSAMGDDGDHRESWAFSDAKGRIERLKGEK